MAQVKIDIDDRAVTEAFNRLLAIGEDPRQALDPVGRVLKTKTQLGFATGTDPYGRQWAPLKARQGQPLRDKGHFMNSIDYQVEGDSVVVGTNLSYAATHQFSAVIEPKPGKFWQTQHTSVGKRGPRQFTVTQPAKLAFMVNGKLVFANKVTIPAREIFPLEGLPQDWSDDALQAIRDVIDRAWSK